MGKQFNISGKNGLYLSNETTVSLTTDVNDPSTYYKNFLIEDYDFFPKNQTTANLFELKNTKYQSKNNSLYGSNAISKSNSALTYSSIYKQNELIANKKYYNTFKFYFKFTGADLGAYTFPGFSGTSAVTLTERVLKGLRIKIYIQLGANFIPVTFTNLQKIIANQGSAWLNISGSDKTGTIASSDGSKVGIELTTGLNSESCIDMRYTTGLSGLFTNIGQNGYSFRVDAALPNFDQVALKNKDYRIIVKYYNIGVSQTGVPVTYQTSESVELMSNNYTYYQQISVPLFSSSLGSGISSEYNASASFEETTYD